MTWDAIDLGDGEVTWTDGSGYNGDLYVWQRSEDQGFALQCHPYGSDATEIPLESTDWRDALDEATIKAADFMAQHEAGRERGPSLSM